jgi:ABC-type Fe3+-hydroxamate transport system substrate-binding protein
MRCSAIVRHLVSIGIGALEHGHEVEAGVPQMQAVTVTDAHGNPVEFPLYEQRVLYVDSDSKRDAKGNLIPREAR